jgi:hypothetical protein
LRYGCWLSSLTYPLCDKVLNTTFGVCSSACFMITKGWRRVLWVCIAYLTDLPISRSGYPTKFLRVTGVERAWWKEEEAGDHILATIHKHVACCPPPCLPYTRKLKSNIQSTMHTFIVTLPTCAKPSMPPDCWLPPRPKRRTRGHRYRTSEQQTSG